MVSEFIFGAITLSVIDGDIDLFLFIGGIIES